MGFTITCVIGATTKVVCSNPVVRGRCRHDCMVVWFTTTYAISGTVPITTDVVPSNLDQGEVYNIMS